MPKRSALLPLNVANKKGRRDVLRLRDGLGGIRLQESRDQWSRTFATAYRSIEIFSS